MIDIDKDGNIIKKNTLIEKIFCFLKKNLAQIVTAFPILTALSAVIANYYSFIASYGYYRYFNIDANLMLPYNRINLYQNIARLSISGLYWAFAIFAVTMFKMKGNYLWKMISGILIPLMINISILCYISNGYFIRNLFSVSIAYLPVQWLMIFSLGYCMVGSFHSKGNSRKKDAIRKEQEKPGETKSIEDLA